MPNDPKKAGSFEKAVQVCFLADLVYTSIINKVTMFMKILFRS